MGNNNKKPDFSQCIQAIKNNWISFYPPESEFTNSKKYFTRANQIRHMVAHQAIDCNTYQHQMECLAKVATAIGRPDLNQKILNLVVVKKDDKEEASIPPEEDHTIEVANVRKDDWTCLKQEGDQLYIQKRWREAMNCFTRAILLNQEEAVLYSSRAQCEFNLLKFDLAREDFEDAIQLDPSNIKHFQIISKVLLEIKLPQESLKVCLQGLQIDPNDDVLVPRERKCRALLASDLTSINPGAGAASLHGENYEIPQINIDEIEDIPNSDTFKERQKLSSSLTKAHDYAKIASQDSQAKAFDIFETAGKQGSAEGLYNMAKFYSEGKAGLPRDLNRAKELCLKAASQKSLYRFDEKIYTNIGVADAECFLGNYHRDGRGVDKCSTEAFNWYLKAAQHDCPTAQYNVGIAHFKGDGCSKNETMARNWFQKAAEHGFSEGQSMYAVMLAGGLGGPVDIDKATEMLQLAADQGNAGALERLQILNKKKGASTM